MTEYDRLECMSVVSMIIDTDTLPVLLDSYSLPSKILPMNETTSFMVNRADICSSEASGSEPGSSVHLIATQPVAFVIQPELTVRHAIIRAFRTYVLPSLSNSNLRPLSRLYSSVHVLVVHVRLCILRLPACIWSRSSGLGDEEIK